MVSLEKKGCERKERRRREGITETDVPRVLFDDLVLLIIAIVLKGTQKRSVYISEMRSVYIRQSIVSRRKEIAEEEQRLSWFISLSFLRTARTGFQ
jgi:hypothetical protein